MLNQLLHLLGLGVFAAVLGFAPAAKAFSPVAEYQVDSFRDSSMIGACTKAANADKANYPKATGGFTDGPKISVTLGTNYCQYQFLEPDNGYMNRTLVVATVNSACPANSSGTTDCQCNVGYTESNGQCTKPVTCTAGQVVASGYFDAGTSVAGGPPAAGCKGGCLAVFDGTFPAGSAVVGGTKHYYARGSYVNFGSPCKEGASGGTSDTLPVEQTDRPADTCAPGQVPGQVNGSTVCVTPGDGTTPPKIEPPKDTNQSTSTSSTETRTNPDGSTTTTTTTTTTGAGGGTSTTTTSTTKNPDGSVRGTTTTTTGTATTKEAEEAGKSECEKNPSGKGCGGEATTTTAEGLYTKKEATVAAILAGASTKLGQAPLASAASGFFNLGATGGGCTAGTWYIDYFKTSIAAPSYCSDFATRMFSIIRVVLLLIATWMAFRVAIDN